MAKSIFYEPTVTFSLPNIMKFPKGVTEIMSTQGWARATRQQCASSYNQKEGRKEGRTEGRKEKEKTRIKRCQNDEIILTG